MSECNEVDDRMAWDPEVILAFCKRKYDQYGYGLTETMFWQAMESLRKRVGR